MLMLVLRTAVILILTVAALSMVFQTVTVIRYAISLMIAVLILLKSVHVSKSSVITNIKLVNQLKIRDFFCEAVERFS